MGTLYTIGTGNRYPVELDAILKANNIGCVIDIRRLASKSWCRTYWAKQPNEQIARIDTFLCQNMVYYEHWEIFGNKFDSLDNYGVMLKCLKRSGHVQQLQNFIKDWPDGNVALLCSEIDANKCHRKMVAEAVLPEGWGIKHL